MEFHNYAYFPSDFDDGEEFYYLSSNDYHKLVNLVIEMRKEYFEKVKSETINYIFLIKSHFKEQKMKKKLTLSIIYYCRTKLFLNIIFMEI